MFSIAIELSKNGKMDMGAIMKIAMSQPKIAKNKKDAPKYAQKLAKSIHSLGAEVLTLDDFSVLSLEKAYLQATLGIPIDVFSADDPIEDPMSKSKQAEPGRPAIYIQ